MKWKYREKEDFALGEKRVIEKFLVFPVCLNGECRWLEKATINQIYGFKGGEYGAKWRNKSWG